MPDYEDDSMVNSKTGSKAHVMEESNLDLSRYTLVVEKEVNAIMRKSGLIATFLGLCASVKIGRAHV